MFFNLKYEEWQQIRVLVKQKLLAFFANYWFLVVAFSSLTASCMFSAALHADFQKKQTADLQKSALKSIGAMPGYIQTMIVMHNLCKQYSFLTEEAKVRNGFYEIFRKDMLWYTEHKADFAGSVATAQLYFNDEINEKLNALLTVERSYGDTPEMYCSNQLLSTQELYEKQNNILNLIYKQYNLM